MRLIISLLLFLRCTTILVAQFPPGADQLGTTAIHKDSSIFVNWAKTIVLERGLQNIGNDSLQYASIGEPDFALAKPDNQTVSLGDNGYAILTFDPPISNGLGADFAVFENGFTTQGGYFLELAFVEVSSDGVNFVRFPATSLTDTTTQLNTFDLVDPTNIHNLAGKYVANYGTPFDLDELRHQQSLDLHNISHVKVIDVIGSIADSLATFDQFGHKVNDPFPTAFPSGGFDLDAIGVIHQKNSTAVDRPSLAQLVSIYPNPLSRNAALQVKLDGLNWSELTLQLFDNQGSYLQNINIKNKTVSIPFASFNSGFYFLKISNHEQTLVKKIVVLEN